MRAPPARRRQSCLKQANPGTTTTTAVETKLPSCHLSAVEQEGLVADEATAAGTQRLRPVVAMGAAGTVVAEVVLVRSHPEAWEGGLGAEADLVEREAESRAWVAERVVAATVAEAMAQVPLRMPMMSSHCLSSHQL